MRILFQSQYPESRDFLEKCFFEIGASVDAVESAADCYFMATSAQYDAVLIDYTHNDAACMSLLSFMRSNGVEIPVITLGQPAATEDRVALLDTGVDDMISKPVVFVELLARIRAILRRGHGFQDQPVLKIADLELNRLSRQVTRAGRPIILQPRQYHLLETLMLRAGEIVTRTTLLEAVWGFHFDPKTTVLETHVSRLRAKIEQPSRVKLLHTIRSAGYMISSEAYENWEGHPACDQHCAKMVQQI